LFYETIVNTGFLCATGLFSIIENYSLNVLLGCATLVVLLSNLEDNKVTLSYNLLIILLFNFVDIKQHSTREMDNFDNVLRVDEKCNRISEFVDRLLPRHVLTP
jgi:hypothetical protein